MLESGNKTELLIERNVHQKACFLYADNDLAFLHTKLFSSIITNPHLKEFSRGWSGKEYTCQFRGQNRWGLNLWVRKVPWRRKWQPAPVFLLGKSQGRGAWWAIVHRMAKSKTWLNDWTLENSQWVSEVGGRWAPGLDSWYLSSRVKFKLCFPYTLQILREELILPCWNCSFNLLFTAFVIIIIHASENQPLGLTAKRLLFMTCPPVDGRKKEINTSPAWGLTF